MKTPILFYIGFLATVFFALPSNAQIVPIPDSQFKAKLVAHIPPIDLNGDGEIQFSEAESYTGAIDISYESSDTDYITDVTGLEAFLNLEEFKASYQNIQTIDLSNNTALRMFDASGNAFTTLDFSNNPSLEFVQSNFGNLQSVDFSNNPSLTWVHLQGNQLNTINISQNVALEGIVLNDNPISALDVSNNLMLRYFYCRGLTLNTLDVSANFNLIALDCQDNPLLTYINLKNGNNQGLDLSGSGASSNFHDLPLLETVCLDEINSPLSDYISNHVDHSVNFTEECTLGLDEREIQSIVSYPNPAAYQLTVRATSPLFSYTIYSVSGKLIKNGTLQGNVTSIPIEQLSSGLYFIQFTDDQNEVATYKFLKR